MGATRPEMGVNLAQRLEAVGARPVTSWFRNESLKRFAAERTMAACTHDLGEVEVKHGERVQIFKLHR